MVMPRKYGGNCLPLNEALSSGMPVIMPDISPNNNLLPKEWLVPASIDGYFTPRGRVDLYSTDLNALREKIEWFKTVNIGEQSEIADKIAESISWETLKEKYLSAIRSVL
jgi:glycosyltransferase involved in cell wall biosynthesis